MLLESLNIPLIKKWSLALFESVSFSSFHGNKNKHLRWRQGGALPYSRYIRLRKALQFTPQSSPKDPLKLCNVTQLFFFLFLFFFSFESLIKNYKMCHSRPHILGFLIKNYNFFCKIRFFGVFFALQNAPYIENQGLTPVSILYYIVDCILHHLPPAHKSLRCAGQWRL